MSKVSIVIPANGERFLQPTITNLIANATDDIEIIAVLDGWWPDPPLENHPKLSILHWGQTFGMRPAINAAVQMAKGDFIMKIDAHCSVSYGFDEVLKSDCADNWMVIPRRKSLDPYGVPFGQIKDNGKSPVDYHFLSYPFDTRPGAGLHGTVWNERARTRLHVLFDDEMSSQGSCWFMTRKHWDRLGDMETHNYGNFIQEMQEIGLKTWLGVGEMKINKNCEYLHWHKGKEGRGYFIDKRQMHRGSLWCIQHWMTNAWAGRTHDLRWLIEKFWPVPTWPTTPDGALDWDAVERDTAKWIAEK